MSNDVLSAMIDTKGNRVAIRKLPGIGDAVKLPIINKPLEVYQRVPDVFPEVPPERTFHLAVTATMFGQNHVALYAEAGTLQNVCLRAMVSLLTEIALQIENGNRKPPS